MVHSRAKRKRLPARFFENDSGRVSVREWLLSLSPDDRNTIGTDIRTGELGWPVGMPLCRSIKGLRGVWKIRSSLADGRIARVFFCAHDGSMAILHGFIKKSQKTPPKELAIAEKRMRGLK